VRVIGRLYADFLFDRVCQLVSLCICVCVCVCVCVFVYMCVSIRITKSVNALVVHFSSQVVENGMMGSCDAFCFIDIPVAVTDVEFSVSCFSIIINCA